MKLHAIKPVNKFEDWFHQPTNFALRSEYFYDDVETENLDRRMARMREWMQAAFEAGQNSVKSYERT